MIAFDSDVLIYAASPQHPLGRRVKALFLSDDVDETPVGVGSTLLIPELIIKPTRDRKADEVTALTRLLSRIDLIGTDRDIADISIELGVELGLKAPDAIHLATAVWAGADQFLTNNSRDFDASFDGIEIIFPADLPDDLSESLPSD